MDDTTPTPAPPATRRARVRTRVIHASRALAENATRGAATGAGTAVGGWITWWLINH
ncbi:hypothetical protein [Embleya sp. NPDC050493]|uniref:hypothetical protein n=1 Tax=Embleya sp. NPDC050493 TaxID=3363989 RepID=UPI0037A11377